jgi:hypothetical protein
LAFCGPCFVSHMYDTVKFWKLSTKMGNSDSLSSIGEGVRLHVFNIIMIGINGFVSSYARKNQQLEQVASSLSYFEHTYRCILEVKKQNHNEIQN